MRIILVLLALLSAKVLATSFQRGEHECPVCGHKSGTSELASYSQFGEPARDLSELPMFRFSRVEICPRDLFASWQSRWGPLKPEEKTRLAEFLKKPSLMLTDAEKELVRGHEAELPGSPWWNLWWARSCDALREPDPRQVWKQAMDLHYGGSIGLGGWHEKLARHYREEAIRQLDAAAQATWPSAIEKRIFAYLRAELTRLAGREDEAKALFAAVVANEQKQKADEDTEWIGKWASEQSLLIDAGRMASKELGGWLSPAMPDPWRHEGEGEPAGWVKHRLALEQLIPRAGRGDEEAAEILWQALDRKLARLLAMAETDEGLGVLRKSGAKWEKWFDEVNAILESGKMPDFGWEEKNDVRVRNVLGRALAADQEDERWEQEVFEPAIKIAIQDGEALKVDLPPREVLERLRKRLKGSSAAERLDAGRMVFRLLKFSGEDRDIVYGVLMMDDELARLEDEKGTLKAELAGEWKSSYWKALCRYLLQEPGSREELGKQPLAKKEDEDDHSPYQKIVWGVMQARKDPFWKKEAIENIATATVLDYSVRFYAMALEDPDLDKALNDRVERLRKMDPKAPETEYYVSEIDEIESDFAERRLEKIPVR